MLSFSLPSFAQQKPLASPKNPSPSPECVGCGWCCIKDQCPESHRAYGYMDRCPDLQWSGPANRYLCLRMMDEDTGQRSREALAEGEGCCARFNDWREDVHNRDDE